MRTLAALMLLSSMVTAQEPGAFPSPDELHKSARAGDANAVRMLLGRGIGANHRDSLGGTPLHDAAWAGEVEAAKVLLEFGADINAHHIEGGSTPLHYAVTTNRLPMVKLLLDRGADVNATFRSGSTALILPPIAAS